MSPACTRLAVVFACLAPLASTPAPLAAQTSPPEPPRMNERTVSVTASGHVSAVPDMAAINTGVLTEAGTAREAMAANTAAMAKLIDGLKAGGLQPRDLHTTSVNVSPRYTTPRDGKAAAINGYTASNQIRIVVHDLARLGEILDTALTLGATQMGGISFDVSKAETLKDEARKEAVANARRRAELFATAAGATVGQVISIAEDVQTNYPGPVLMTARAKSASAPVPVEAGAVQLDATVSVTWSLK